MLGHLEVLIQCKQANPYKHAHAERHQGWPKGDSADHECACRERARNSANGGGKQNRRHIHCQTT